MTEPTPDAYSRIGLDLATGTLSDGAIRYVTIRADGLMGAFVGTAVKGSLTALCESVYRHGRDSLVQYQSEHGNDPTVLMATVAHVAATLGWGAWVFTRAGPKELKLTVHNSPFAEAAGASEVPLCAPILGMMRAVGELVLGGAVHAQERECAACGAVNCEFVVCSAATST
jgi:uncharacterized protein